MLALIESLLNCSLYFFLFLLALSPLEKVFPAHKQRFFRAGYTTDLIFFFAGNILWAQLTLFVLKNVAAYLDQVTLIDISGWPVWLQVITALGLSDIFIYWAHRLSHSVDFLWRFHSVHHSAEQLDWLAAYREHPFDNLYTRLIENLPFLFLGVSLETIAVYVLFRGLWGNFIHSNSDIDLGIFKYVLGSPRLHHWHHDAQLNSRVNFANLMPVLDVIFGTFHDEKRFPAKYGYDGLKRQNYLEYLVVPLLPKRFL